MESSWSWCVSVCALKRAMAGDVCVPGGGLWALHIACYIQYYTCGWNRCPSTTQKPACVADCCAMQRCPSYLQLQKRPALSASVGSLSIYTPHITTREETPPCRQRGKKREGHGRKKCLLLEILQLLLSQLCNGSVLSCSERWAGNARLMWTLTPVFSSIIYEWHEWQYDDQLIDWWSCAPAHEHLR